MLSGTLLIPYTFNRKANAFEIGFTPNKHNELKKHNKPYLGSLINIVAGSSNWSQGSTGPPLRLRMWILLPSG